VESERRSEERCQMKVGVAVRRSVDPSEKPGKYLARNITSKGIFLELNGSEHLSAGQHVYLEIDLGRLNGGDKPVQVKTRGRVVRCQADGVAILFNGRSNLTQK
jgi:hypothetical protein